MNKKPIQNVKKVLAYSSLEIFVLSKHRFLFHFPAKKSPFLCKLKTFIIPNHFDIFQAIFLLPFLS